MDSAFALSQSNFTVWILSRSKDIVRNEKALLDGELDDRVHGTLVRTRKKMVVVFAPHLLEASCEFVMVSDGVFGVDSHREFCKMVQKISIYTSEEVKKMRPRSKFPVAPASEGERGGGVASAAVLQVSKIESIQN